MDSFRTIYGQCAFLAEFTTNFDNLYYDYTDSTAYTVSNFDNFDNMVALLSTYNITTYTM